MGIGQTFIVIIVIIAFFLVPLSLAISIFLAFFSSTQRAYIRKRWWLYALWSIASLSIIASNFPWGPGERFGSSREARTAATMSQIQIAILAYQTEYNMPPPGKDNATLIRELITDNPRSIVFLNLRPTDMNARGEALDAWGTPFHISLADPQDPLIQSAGPDKKWNTPDDMDTSKKQR